MDEWNTSHLEILAKMVRVPVYGDHHKQTDTIQGWVDLEGDVFSEAMDDLITDPQAPVRQKGRGTVQLTSVYETKEFIEEHDDEEEYSWYL